MRILQSTPSALSLHPSEEQEAFRHSTRRFLEGASPGPGDSAAPARAVEALGLQYFAEDWLTSPERDCVALCMAAEEFGAADLGYALECLVHLPAIWLLQAAGQDPHEWQQAGTDQDAAGHLGIGAWQHADSQRSLWLLLPQSATRFVALRRQAARPVLVVGTVDSQAAALAGGSESGLPLHRLSMPNAALQISARLTIDTERQRDLTIACSSALILVAAVLVGAMRASTTFAFGYTSRRKSFDKPLINHQAIAMRLAGIATRLEAVRLLLWRAASAHANDLGECCRLASQVQQTTRLVFPEVVQLCGAHGFVAGLPACSWFQTGNSLGMMLTQLARTFRGGSTPS